MRISLRKAIAGHKLVPGYNVKYDGQIKTLDEQNDASSGALTLLVVPVAGVEKLSFVRLFRRSRQEKPVLVSAGAEEEAALARVVNGQAHEQDLQGGAASGSGCGGDVSRGVGSETTAWSHCSPAPGGARSAAAADLVA